jgi:hypothetical protein
MSFQVPLFLILQLVALSSSSAFVPVPPTRTPFARTSTTRIPESSASSNGEFISGGDVESAREAFEELIQDESVSSQLFPQHPLTSVSRRRRQVEMALLDSLRESDDAVDEILHLWVTERDEDSASKILQMQEQCSAGLVEEERLLRQMVERHPTWTEPVLRLATLLYYKGRTEESYQMAIDALELKPWHIEAPQLLVLLSLRNQDVGQALYWARRGLPPLRGDAPEDRAPSSHRRQRWVERALGQAQEQLVEAELAIEEFDRRAQEELISDEDTTHHHEAWQ